jgi:hypothetical protein
MSWLNPIQFLWLLALVPPLVLLYFLKLRRREVLLPSTLLWSRSIRDLRANAPFQRLRRNLLLFLQLLLLVLVAAALARPVLVGRKLPGRYKVLLLDQSASMACRDEDGLTRLEAALDAARDIVDDPDREYVMIIGFGASAHTYCAFSDSTLELHRALENVRQLHTPTRVTEALRVARTALRGKSSGSILVLSDGGFTDRGPAEEGEHPVHYLPFGSGSENAGIVGLGVRRPMEQDGPGRTEVLVTLQSHHAGEKKFVLELREGETLVDAAEVVIRRGEEAGHVFRLPWDRVGAYRVALTPGDSLEADDSAWFVLAPPAPMRVALVSEGDYFLKRALEENTQIDVLVLSPEQCFRKEGGRTVFYPEQLDTCPDVLIFDRAAPDNPLTINALYLGAFPVLPGLTIGEPATEPLVIDWNRTHPITRYTDFSSLYLRKTVRFNPPPQAQTLIEAREGPLAACQVRQGVRTVWTGFSLHESDWPVQVSFPVFLKNALAWLSPPAFLHGSEPSLRPGDPLPVPFARGERMASVTSPDGRTTTLSRPQSGTAYFPETNRVGLYRVTHLGSERQVPCHLASPIESNTAPQAEVSLGGVRVKAGDARENATREFWRLAILLAILLLGLEWYIYHRRSL